MTLLVREREMYDKGIDKGIELGIDKGIELERKQGIQKSISMLKSAGFNQQDIIAKVSEAYDMKKEEVLEYLHRDFK